MFILGMLLLFGLAIAVSIWLIHLQKKLLFPKDERESNASPVHPAARQKLPGYYQDLQTPRGGGQATSPQPWMEVLPEPTQEKPRRHFPTGANTDRDSWTGLLYEREPGEERSFPGGPGDKDKSEEAAFVELRDDTPSLEDFIPDVEDGVQPLIVGGGHYHDDDHVAGHYLEPLPGFGTSEEGEGYGDSDNSPDNGDGGED